MTFPGANCSNDIQPQLNAYFNGSTHFQRNYYAQQSAAYPLFHPAAMAAVAAAAAGYSQQIGTRVVSPRNILSVVSSLFRSRDPRLAHSKSSLRHFLGNSPLNLTSPGCRGIYPFGAADAARASYYHHNFGVQPPGFYAGTPTVNGFTSTKPTFQLPLSSPSVSRLQTTHKPADVNSFFSPSPVTNTSQVIEGHSGLNAGTSTPMSRGSKSHGQKTANKTRIKKSVNADEVASRRRQEFDELVKARTEKLLSDGPVCTTTSTSGPLSSSSSGGGSTCAGTSARESSSSPNYKKLIEAVLDAKKSALLRSPSVMAYLESQQRSLAEFKRRTELFCVDGKK
ncbi:uncharacterized protein DEA37_0003004 [Paragonimus westermani]|uniref:Regulatory factor X-associated protein RFXANK-binding domain-containing protein n=1 Tax=Paragonimus westermani TaxID=34504 RepID=A0A5J4NZU6_9TREM|nr:uncharacterized protein DEA37_0003004 [Paragonimus westermani]